MGYDQAVAQLLALGHELHATPSHKFDLAHMRALLDEMGHPERRFPCVLIAGTNGKGSTAATLASILVAADYRTALYTSPHLRRVNERIRISGEPIGDAEFAAIHDRVDTVARRLVERGTLPWPPSFFEMLTAMAFDYFAESAVDIAVLEVGMGGRLDATNVVEPALAVITDIALDHQKYLGNTIGEIAREKAGIIRPGARVVTLPQHPEANDVLGNTILERGAIGINAVPYVAPVSPNAEPVGGPGARNRFPLEVMGEKILVDSPLYGRHQLRNLALAIAAAVELNQCGFTVTPAAIARGLRETKWPGRFQALESGGRDYVLDVAHNPAGAWALRSALTAYAGERPLTMIFGAMRDKAIAEMAEVLFPLAERVVATRAENPRSAAPEEIRAAASRVSVEIEEASDVAAALRCAQASPSQHLIVITGSIYVVGEALQFLTPGC